AGRRVQEVSTYNVEKVFVYDAFGQMAAEYSLGAQSLPCTTCYIATDHLGSTRMVTDQNANVVGRHDYLPFGEEIAANTGGRDSTFGTQDFVNQKFTGQERDSETGLDFFQARYFSAALGRFNSPDPGNAAASLFNPQSWNGYSYVANNPLTLIDPTGMDTCPEGSENNCVDVNGGPPDPISTDPCFFFNCWSAGSGYYDKPLKIIPPPPPPPKVPIILAKQTFSQCMAAHANDFSILGSVNAGTNAIFNRHDTYKNYVILGAFAGNSITSLLYGSASDAAGTGTTIAPTIVTTAMGTATSYGRRTSTIMALNIAGKGGLPLALGASSAGAKS